MAAQIHVFEDQSAVIVPFKMQMQMLALEQAASPQGQLAFGF
jgi:hypothetical protein